MHLGAIPSTLSRHLCVDFVNSRFDDYRGTGTVHDRLELEEWRRWFVARCGLGAAPALSSADRLELLDLRALLRQLLESRRPPGRRDLVRLNGHLARSRQAPELVVDRAGIELRPHWTEPGWPAVVAVVATSYARLLVGGGIERVRVCRNPDCSYMFVDESRAGSRRWCDVAVCGNLLRVRRHRDRRGLA